MKSKNTNLNRSKNGLADIHEKVMYDSDYNVRHLPRPKAVTGDKLTEYERLENLRKENK